ncbi:MAG: hypothetical protein WB341_12575 [Terracidiphilus sp.]
MATKNLNKRPIAITFLAWLYITIGVVGIAVHAELFKVQPPELSELGLLAAAVVAGIFMLRGKNWARWLALAWMAFHVGVSAFHPWRELIAHSVLLVMIAYLLLQRDARNYFAAPRTAA